MKCELSFLVPETNHIYLGTLAVLHLHIPRKSRTRVPNGTTQRERLADRDMKISPYSELSCLHTPIIGLSHSEHMTNASMIYIIPPDLHTSQTDTRVQTFIARYLMDERAQA